MNYVKLIWCTLIVVILAVNAAFLVRHSIQYPVLILVVIIQIWLIKLNGIHAYNAFMDIIKRRTYND